jgi:basic membrane protein A and related proteins
MSRGTAFARQRQRTRLALELAAIVWGIAALCGCSKRESESLSSTAAAATAQAPAPSPLKVAFLYAHTVDVAGWNFAHEQARQQVQQKLGSRVETSFVDHVPEGADAERVLNELCEQNNRLIFGTSFGFMKPLIKAAAEHPDVKFENATGLQTSSNLRTYNSRLYEAAYLAGVVAGALTKSNILGVVGSIPVPDVIRNIDAFTLGAQSQNPQIRTKVVWVNEWFNPPKERDAAQALLNQGADVLLQCTDSAAVLEAAERAGKYAFGTFSDMHEYAPKAHLASVSIDWAPYYEKAIRDVLDGTWQTGQTWWGVREGTNDLVGWSADVPPHVKEVVERIKAGLRDGSFAIWKGPLFDTAGTEVVGANQTVDDEFLRRIDFYVRGVEGKLPH